MGLVKEFKEFAMRGNVMDMAVGVIVGGAFGKIVSSLVDDILMPIVGSLTGGVDFTGLAIKIGDANIKYGSFIQNIVDFLIIAFCIFLFVKALNEGHQSCDARRGRGSRARTHCRGEAAGRNPRPAQGEKVKRTQQHLISMHAICTHNVCVAASGVHD